MIKFPIFARAKNTKILGVYARSKAEHFMESRQRKIIIGTFLVLAIISVFLAVNRLSFSFNFEDFFPKGDPDLEFFNDFKKKFEPDDNFLIVAIKREEGVFDQDFLKKVEAFTYEVKTVESVIFTQSLATVRYPINLAGLGMGTTVPVVHINEPERYEKDRKKILSDELLLNTLINKDGTTLAVFLKTVDNISQTAAENLVDDVDRLIEKFEFKEVHMLGRANFQKELVAMQIKEFKLSVIVSSVLVFIVMFLIFRRYWGIMVSVTSIGLGLGLFVGFLGLKGQTLDAMSALYPIIMIIVGTSDVIHVLSKYVDELSKGHGPKEAIRTTLREIGIAILLTSTTTAIGFLSLMTSRIGPIQSFGLNAAAGVMIAYITILLFTTAVLTFFKGNQIIKISKKGSWWTAQMERLSHFTKARPKEIVFGTLLLLLICGFGISKISTDYRIANQLPKGAKITSDFFFFEKEFSGFRPFEIAVFIQDGYTADDYAVIKEIGRLEDFVRQYPAIQSLQSATGIYKLINRAYHGNQSKYYTIPVNEKDFNKYKKLAKQSEKAFPNVLLSKDKKSARISARMLDIGADSIKVILNSVNDWAKQEIDTSLIKVKQTGTGIIVDKNSIYVRDSLIKGLGFAILVVSLLMALIFRSVKMVLISLVPNVLPMLIAGAMLGFVGIDLDAGVAIVFAIIFGIAVDDTIHLLSKYRLCKAKGMSNDEAVHVSLLETGKALCLTTIILFFGFTILVFSSNPPSVAIGSMISLTLVSALVCDLLLIPVMLRKWMK